MGREQEAKPGDDAWEVYVQGELQRQAENLGEQPPADNTNMPVVERMGEIVMQPEQDPSALDQEAQQTGEE